SVCVASVARTVLRAVRDTVGSVARALWNWIFFLTLCQGKCLITLR
ncbi:hypothetical protein OHF04_25795, partial [Escherichia coli]|nr:hypothetical protein [Escherichia coli]